MNYDGRAIANFILDYCQSKGRDVTNLSLQKIVYFCHVWSLIKLGQPLVKQEFEAWQFGPVLQYLYREFKDFGDAPITKRSTRTNPLDGTSEIVAYKFDLRTEDFLTKVLDFYTRLSAAELVALSHARGSPWDQTWNHEGDVNLGMKIDNLKIQHYYSKVREPFTLQ